MPTGPRYLVKDIDHFAGFAHAIHTYLGGVALADHYGMRLLHMPFQSAHGLGFAFDDFLAGDERDLVAPLVAPVLIADDDGRLLIDGRRTNVSTVQRTASQETVAHRLRAALADSVTHVRKGRFAFADGNATRCADCSQTPEARYTALWMRERFWRAVRAREQQPPPQQQPALSGRSRRARTAPAAAVSASGAAAGEPSISVAVHVRRGDVTYLDRYGKPSGAQGHEAGSFAAALLIRAALESLRGQHDGCRPCRCSRCCAACVT